MILHRDFQKLRMAAFLPPEDIDLLENWEFHDRIWIGEGYLFTEWLRSPKRQDALVMINIDLDTFPAASAVLDAVQLQLSRGYDLQKVVEVLGCTPSHVYSWTAQRTTYTFDVNDPDAYRIMCTLTNGKGLHYVHIEALS